jgi:hypothetical protein
VTPLWLGRAFGTEEIVTATQNLNLQGDRLLEGAALELGAQAWKLRTEGLDLLNIAKQMNMPLTVLSECLAEFECKVGMEAGRAFYRFRAVDIERLEKVIGQYLPIAISKTGKEQDFDKSLKAAYIVLEAIGSRTDLLDFGPTTERHSVDLP